MRALLAAICCVCAAVAAEADPEALDRAPPPRPGHETPVAAAEACVLRFNWDTYRTIIVVGEGVGMVKPAWVATFEDGAFHVGYRATAFRDGRGRLHVDARHARDVGPHADNWIPDSFAFGHKLLWTLDDQDSGHTADMGERTTAAKDRAGWTAELLRLQALIEGGL